MDSGGPSPYCGPVVDLVDPYTTKETASDAALKLADWMNDHPGRWVLFMEGDLGIHPKNLQTLGFEVTQMTSRTTGVRRAYARLPHPEGEPLGEALERTREGRAIYPNDLPDLQRDSFDWTEEELRAAVQAARENLFPVRAGRGSRRRR
jgi:hypothetical protein